MNVTEISNLLWHSLRTSVQGSAAVERHGMDNDKRHLLQFNSTNGQFSVGEHLVEPDSEILINIFNEWRPLRFKLDDSPGHDHTPLIDMWTVETSGPHELSGFPARLFVGYPAACDDAELYDYYHMEDLSCLRSERAYHHLNAICEEIRRELWLMGLRAQNIAWRRPRLRKSEIETLFEIDQKAGELTALVGEIQRRGGLLQDKVMRYAELYGWLSAGQMHTGTTCGDKEADAAAEHSPLTWWQTAQYSGSKGSLDTILRDDVIPF